MSNIMASLEDHKESGNKNKNGKRFDCHMGKKQSKIMKKRERQIRCEKYITCEHCTEA